jgi:hypothetical protein
VIRAIPVPRLPPHSPRPSSRRTRRCGRRSGRGSAARGRRCRPAGRPATGRSGTPAAPATRGCARAWGAVVAPLHLEQQRPGVGLVLARLRRQEPHDFLLVQEVAGHHREHEPAVVADVRPRLQGVEQVGQHRRVAQVVTAGVVRGRRPVRLRGRAVIGRAVFGGGPGFAGLTHQSSPCPGILYACTKLHARSMAAAQGAGYGVVSLGGGGCPYLPARGGRGVGRAREGPGVRKPLQRPRPRPCNGRGGVSYCRYPRTRLGGTAGRRGRPGSGLPPWT